MEDTIVYFYPSDNNIEIIGKLFLEQKIFLESLIPYVVDIQHVGSSSILGALSKGDLDIQIRVSSENFEKIKEILNLNFKSKRQELWNEGFSIFGNEEKGISIDYMITTIDSSADDFYKVRDFLRKNPAMLARYNEVKKIYHGKNYSEYRIAKSEFFGGNGRVKFLDN